MKFTDIVFTSEKCLVPDDDLFPQYLEGFPIVVTLILTQVSPQRAYISSANLVFVTYLDFPTSTLQAEIAAIYPESEFHSIIQKCIDSREEHSLYSNLELLTQFNLEKSPLLHSD